MWLMKVEVSAGQAMCFLSPRRLESRCADLMHTVKEVVWQCGKGMMGF